MPLIKSGSKKAVSANIRAEMAAGKPQKQAIAIALDVARRSRRKADGGAVEDELLPPPRTPTQMPDAWNDAVRKVAKGVVDTVAAPGRAMQGKYAAKPERPGLWSEEDEFRHQHAQRQQVEDAAAMSMDVAGARFPFAKAGEAGIFGGKLARTANLDKLRRAEEYIAKGYDPNLIRQETGWFQGADGKWRFEISDDMSRLLPTQDRVGQTPKTGDYLSHPELYEAYPDLKTTNIFKGAPHGTAYYQPSGLGRGNDIIGLPHARTPEDRRLLLHELQHAIQRAEGFSEGASINALMPLAEEQMSIAKARALAKNPEMESVLKKSLGNMTQDDIAKLTNFYKEVPDARKLAGEAYMRHAGEVEARNVERRMNMNPVQRWERSPQSTEDRPREVQFIKGIFDMKKADGGSAMQRTRGYAAGGAPRIPGPSFFQRDANRALSRQSGLIKSVVPGRTDKHNMRVASGSYILPSDIVSHLGQNNTLAGAKFLKRKFGGGGVLQFADGGEVPMAVPIVAAGGEFVLNRDQVRSVGGGDIKKGHDILDKFVLDTRADHIKTLKNLAPPRRS